MRFIFDNAHWETIDLVQIRHPGESRGPGGNFKLNRAEPIMKGIRLPDNELAHLDHKQRPKTAASWNFQFFHAPTIEDNYGVSPELSVSRCLSSSHATPRH